jgi:hypothetical protein
MPSPILIIRRQQSGKSIFRSRKLTSNPIIGVQSGYADTLRDLLKNTFQECLRPEFFEAIRRELDLANCCIVDADQAMVLDD